MAEVFAWGLLQAQAKRLHKRRDPILKKGGLQQRLKRGARSRAPEGQMTHEDVTYMLVLRFNKRWVPEIMVLGYFCLCCLWGPN